MRPAIPVTYPSELPISTRRDEIAVAIAAHRVVIVCGETGSGKSTQLPKICLEMGRGRERLIGITQPRRIAARSVAARLAEELHCSLGQQVGFQIRFTDQTSAATSVKVMTDGILLAEVQRDHLFSRYDTLIIDEAHERSLNIDFLLGLTRRALERRDDLKVIITSATLDAEKFSQYYQFHAKRAPVIVVEGRTFPIEVRYKEPQRDEDEADRIVDTVAECTQEGDGDILVFLATERDIADASKALKHSAVAVRCDILPLYARLPLASQQKIFAPSKHRKIVLATNVAESSLTVPNIRFVIDTGRARISRWSPDSKTQRLPIEAISQSSAKQRAGRCGRVRDGICLRLYSEEDFVRRDRDTTPEIQRTNLAAVVLQALSMRLGRLESFPFIDPPSRRAISDGYKTLFEIGAIDDRDQLTPLGSTLARLPIDPRLARVIIAAAEENCLAEMLVIVAALEIQDPRERPPEFAASADAAHAKFLDPQSDFLSLLRLWQFATHLKETLSHGQLRKACQQNFISANRLREWSELHVQLMRLVHQTGIVSRETAETRVLAVDTPQKYTQKYAAIHRAILAGFLSRVAQREREGNAYILCGGGTFRIWRGSGLVKQEKNYGWILAAESIETSQRFLRTVARIEPNWIESLGQHLLRHTVSSPHWDEETGYVHAYEKVTLFSLVIVPKRRVNFGSIDAAAARDIFIQEALTAGRFGTLAEESRILAANIALREEARHVQDKLRRYDIVRGELFLHQYYQERLPATVCDKRSLLQWERRASEGEKQRLTFTLGDILAVPLDAATRSLFPDHLPSKNGASLPLEYRFAPGEANDGVTVIVLEKELPSLDAARLGWLVPGLLEQKVEAMLRGLPKTLRTKLVPIPDTSRQIAASLEFGSGAFETALATAVSRACGERITARDLGELTIPEPLRAQVRVVADGGETITEGRDICQIREELGLTVEPVTPEIDTHTQTVLAFVDKNHRKLCEQVKWLPLPKRYGVASFSEDDIIFLLASIAVNTSISIAAQEAAVVLPKLAENLGRARLTVEQNKKPFPDAARDAADQLARLTGDSFLRRTPWRWLKEMPRYLEAIFARFEKIRGGGIKSDGDFTREIAALETQFKKRFADNARCGIDDAHLADFAWFLEEYRVSCFAQKLGTSVKVSAKRLGKMLE